MIREHTIGYKGMLKDLAKGKQSEKYFDAKNIRILSTDQQSSLALTNEAGNELLFDIPTPVFNTNQTRIEYDVNSTTKTISYTRPAKGTCELEDTYGGEVSGVQTIIGVKELRESILIVTTDGQKFDCFWEIEGINTGEYQLVLKYMNNLGLSKDNLMQILFNYENSVLEKIYFVDGANQLRFFNLRQSIENGDTINLIDVSASSIDTVSTFKMSQISVDNVISGGSHTSGMIQYAYSLYILNGSQTVISPLSSLVPIDKGFELGGGEVNESLGKSVTVSIPELDSKFTHIKLYSIKYTSFNETPEVKIISDQEIDANGSFSFTDTGAIGTNMSLEAFVFLGSAPIIPKHIATKDNRLFAINVKEQSFDVDIDTRAYSFNSSSVAKIMENVNVLDSGAISGTYFTVPNTWNVPGKHDCINADYDTYKYQSDGTTLGATGKYIQVELDQNFINDVDGSKIQSFKDREIYRLGIKFFNRRGQDSEAKWIMDLKAPEGNLQGTYNQLKVELTSEFYTWLADESNFSSEDDKPVGYRIIRADRQLADRTILTQGMINPMVANYVHRGKDTSLAKRKEYTNSDDSNKMPSITRGFAQKIPFNECNDYLELASPSSSQSNLLQADRNAEGFASTTRDRRAQTFQHNRLMQMFSPEISFGNVQIDSSYLLNVVGLASRDAIANWGTETNPVTGLNTVEAKFINGINSNSPGVTAQDIISSPIHLNDHSFYGPTNGTDTRATNQVYQSFTGLFYTNNGIREHNIYGSPEVTEAGADYRAYNNDYSLRYCNHLKTMLLDDWRENSAVNRDCEVQIRGMNSNGAKCITFAEGPDDVEFDVGSRKSIEKIKQLTGISESDGILIAEFIRDDSIKYIGGIYGGNSYEAKKNASYIDIGDYTDINTNSVFIESPGDTFVHKFTFAKIAKDDVDIESREYNVISEIVSIRVETSIDVKNRNDLSLTEWDNRWQPRMDEYFEYNQVYSQQPTLVQSTSVSAKVKKIKEFDGRIISSKVKIPGEFIDSWTDFLENETMDLDGKYGPINAVINLKDEIFCLQDTAVARLSINPRVQTVGSDGIQVELGTGNVLHDYTYLTTNSGCLNRFGVVATPKGFYYVDILNRSIVRSDGQAAQGLSDAEGFHSELVNTLDFDSLLIDNPVLGTGVSTGFNSVNGDVYFSFLQSTDDFTLAFNERANSFTSYYDYIPAWYINKGNVLITTNKSHNQLWEHFKGAPNSFYGETFKSSVTFHLASEGREVVLNGASFKMELTKDGNLVPNEGLTAVRVYNDRQDSGEVELVMRRNMYNKFANWKLTLPRNLNSRERVRGPWGFVELQFDNPDGKKLVLHDVTLSYTQH